MANPVQQPQGIALRRTLCFYSPPPDGSDPEYVEGASQEPGRRNYPHRKEKVLITDIRRHENSFTLDEHSFAALPEVFDQEINFTAPEEITEKYLPWVQKLIRKHIPYCVNVAIFNWLLRKASATKTFSRQVHKIHIDQSPTGAFLRARRHLSADHVTAIENGQAYFRIINVWKPVFRTVRDHPITFAESRSLRAADLVPVRQVSSDYVGETYAVKHREGQRFRYWSDMKPEDVVLIQCFDSREQSWEDGVNGGLKYVQCAHGSFQLAEEEQDETCTRESIEVRCLVVVATM
ncbi:hypothetical protein F5B22DRAFT_655223 [Xylaria bambusicola]|uniref:uncharacterized protein n=1 Tax=Xylaria bambusicola TaxID=326684 RepID=UPI002007760C|nr:uncharacterized protein F5B22DRAFT_655223 [Xylaria bambusicola]KAI0516903.1 hypothetical protein F5B22DRAFT_655223 [Xylaria bambusicola]